MEKRDLFILKYPYLWEFYKVRRGCFLKKSNLNTSLKFLTVLNIHMADQGVIFFTILPFEMKVKDGAWHWLV